MSTGSSTNHDQPSVKITLTRNDDGWWTARDETRGLTAQGETREEALSNLDDVIDAVENDVGWPPTDEALREAGIDHEANRRAGRGELPDVLKQCFAPSRSAVAVHTSGRVPNRLYPYAGKIRPCRESRQRSANCRRGTTS